MSNRRKLLPIFENNVLPTTIGKLIGILDKTSKDTAEAASDRWKLGNSAVAQGWMRRQDIFEELKRVFFEESKSASLPSFEAMTFSYKGTKLHGDERVQNITLAVVGGNIAIGIMQKQKDYFRQKDSAFLEKLSKRNSVQETLNPDWKKLYPEELLNQIDYIFLLEYTLDTTDLQRGVVDQISITIPSQNRKVRECLIKDARAYAVSVPISHSEEPDGDKPSS
jgi:hypothetical protein